MNFKRLISTAAALTVAFSMTGGLLPAAGDSAGTAIIAEAASASVSAPEYIFARYYDYGVKAEVEVKWNKVEGADYYNIYRYNSSKKKYVKIAKTTENSYRGEFGKAKKYSFKVTAVRKINGKYSESAKSPAAIAAAEAEAVPKKVSVSEDCKFYDFQLVKAKTSSVSSSAASRAVGAVKKSGYYSMAMTDIDQVISTADDNVKKYLDSSGRIKPKASRSYNYDYNGDGRKESFILVDFPMYSGYGSDIVSALVYADGRGKYTVMDMFYAVSDDEYDSPTIIDYGDFKQLYIGGGTFGYNTFWGIYGERNGSPKCYAASRCGIEKCDCFLTINAFMGMGGTYYFDTTADEYRYILGRYIDKEKVLAMDSTGVFDEFGSEELEFTVVGGNYYLCTGHFISQAYIYKNGSFTLPANGMRSYMGGVSYADNYVEDIDIDNAVKNMKKVK